MRLLLLLFPIWLMAGNLQDLITAGEQNEKLLAAKANRDATIAALDATLPHYLPSIDIGASHTQLDNPGTIDPKETTSYTGTVTAVLFDGGKREALLSQSSAQSNAAEANFLFTKENLTLQIIQNYYGYHTTTAAIEAKKMEIRQLEAELERLVRFHKAGTIAEDEVDKFRARVANVQVSLSTLELSAMQIRYTLQALTGLDEPIEGGSLIAVTADANKSDRQDLKAMTYQYKAARKEIWVRRSGYLPNITLQDTYTKRDLVFEGDLGFPLDYPDTQNQIAVSLSWNIFNFGATSYETQSARYSALAQKATLDYETRKADLDLEYAKKALITAQAIIDAARLQAEASEKTYLAIQKKFRAGVVDNIAYLDALAQTYQAKAGLVQAQNDYEVKKAQYLFYAGKPIKEHIQ